MRNSYQTEAETHTQKKLFQSRLMFAFGLVTLLFFVLIFRMGYLQWTNYKHYHAMAEGNRISVAPIPPTRGRIFDRNQILLADNTPIYNLQFLRFQMTDLEESKRTLKKILPEIAPDTLDDFFGKLLHTNRYKAQYLPYKLSEQQAARFAVNSYQLPGISLQSRLQRYYPYGSSVVHALGYVGKINLSEAEGLNASRYQGTDIIGKLGIEKFYESELHGYPGIQQIETNAKGRVLKQLETIPAVNGKDLILTLDIQLQQYIETLLQDKKAAVVVTNPHNGEILAYVSTPGYDPNLFVDGISHQNYNNLLNNKNHPLINRVINGQYPPGSTVKPFVGLTALEQNSIPAQKKIFDPGYFIYKEHRYRDWKRTGHGLVDMDAAITQSCDTYFYELGLSMGIDLINEGLEPFGFGHATGIDLQGESSGILPSKKWKLETKGKSWFNGETIIATIGQGYFLSTPIQLAKAISILANRGSIITPHLVKTNNNDKVQPEQIPIVNNQNWDKIITAMTHVMHAPTGTARSYARNLPFKMAGKTGTAQVYSLNEGDYDADSIDKKLRDHSLFVGFAPVKEPKIAITVIIENSSQKAAPVAIDIAKYYLTQDRLR